MTVSSDRGFLMAEAARTAGAVAAREGAGGSDGVGVAAGGAGIGARY